MAVYDLNYHKDNDLISFCNGRKFRTVLADPPWRFRNRTGKISPEYGLLYRYPTMKLEEIMELPVNKIADVNCHLYLWVPNALIEEGLKVLNAWGFKYKTNIVWEKVRKDGNPDGSGLGFYFRNVTELLLFGTRGNNAGTLSPGRSQVNLIRSRKREHSRKPDEIFDLIERCSNDPYLELFARGSRKDWLAWGNQADDFYDRS
jgi:N6-adenosine-specific RNA methylase IME4